MSRFHLPPRSPRLLGLFVSLLVPVFAVQVTQAEYSADLVGDWPTYGNGPAHTGYFPGTLNGLPFVAKWKAPMPNWNVSQAAIGNGRAFVTVGWYYGPMSLRTLDADTGEPLWTNNFASAYAINPPTYDDGSVYVQWTEGLNPSQLYKFDAASGANPWSAPFTAQAHNYMAPIVADGTVYANTGYYVELSGYDRINGANRFTVPLLGNGCDEWAPAYSGGKVYTWVNGILLEHNPSTGARNWAVTNATQDEFWYSMERTLAVADGRAYFTSTTKLMAVDLATHVNLWEVPGGFSGTPAVANGIVYAISNSVVSAYTTNGAFVRVYDTTNHVEDLTGQLIVTDDVLITAGSYGVYVFRLADGMIQQLISSFRTPCYCYYSSKISLANNTLYISSGDGNLYAHSASNLLQFTISSSSAPLGSPTPNAYGLNYVLSGSSVTNSVPSPIAGLVNTRYVVMGWTGTGSVPASGDTNTVSFVASADSTLTWNFQTQYYLNTGVNGSGTIDVPDSWQSAGSILTIIATPNTYYHLANWSGDVTGTSNTITFSMDGPRNVTANFSANLVTNAVPEWWLAQYGLPISDAGALDDTDQDDFPNWKEFYTGTNPTNSTSYLELTATLNSSQLVLRWPGASGRRYRVLRATNHPAGFLPIATNLYGSRPYTYYYLNQPIPNPSFYWIQAE